MMKKVLPLLLSLILGCTLLFGCAPVAEYGVSSVTPFQLSADRSMIVGDLKEFVYGDREIDRDGYSLVSESILNRTAFSTGANGSDAAGEKAAAKRITDLLGRYGYLNGDVEGADLTLPNYKIKSFALDVQKGSLFNQTVTTVYSQNVIATLPTSGDSLGKVLIMTHYDNLWGSDLIAGSKSHGVYSDGISVAAVIRAADLAKQANNFPFDLEFVFFGAGEPGNYGSANYLSEMSVSDTESVLLAVDLDRIGGGDYDYLFCDDVATGHESYLRAAAQSQNISFQSAPQDKQAIVLSGYGPAYAHAGWLGDHYGFYRKKLNVAAFFGMNWSVNGVYGYTESADNESILTTQNDNLLTVEDLYPDYAERACNVVNTVMTAINGKSVFAEAMRESSERNGSYSWLQNRSIPSYVVIGLIIVLFVVLSVVSRRMMKRRPKPEDIVEQPKETVFPFEDFSGNAEQPKAEESQDPKNPFEGY